MTAYIRRGGEKKRAQFERAEAAFTRALANGESQARLENLAEKLRVAQLGYLKSRLYELGDDGNALWRERRNQYRIAERRWETMTFAEIRAVYTPELEQE